VFDTSQSRNWKELGAYQLGLNLTNMGGNGDYGLDMISFHDPRTRIDNQYDNVLIAAINETDYYQGFIGVGVNQGRFKNNLTLPFISQMAQTYGTIPSHSYGYTAGAYYRPCKRLLQSKLYRMLLTSCSRFEFSQGHARFSGVWWLRQNSI
jgi:hypothetical protein